MTAHKLPTLTPAQRREFARLYHDINRYTATIPDEPEQNERTDAVSLNAASMVATDGGIESCPTDTPTVAAIEAAVSAAAGGEGE